MRHFTMNSIIRVTDNERKQKIFNDHDKEKCKLQDGQDQPIAFEMSNHSKLSIFQISKLSQNAIVGNIDALGTEK